MFRRNRSEKETETEKRGMSVVEILELSFAVVEESFKGDDSIQAGQNGLCGVQGRWIPSWSQRLSSWKAQALPISRIFETIFKKQHMGSDK